MTNNIEKLYELAGIDRKKPKCLDCFFENQSCLRSYDECPSFYPPFTDTKQLDIIKLMSSEFTVRINSNPNGTFIMLMQSAKTFLWASDDKFEQALAKLVCELWEYLTKEAKQKIKRILE